MMKISNLWATPLMTAEYPYPKESLSSLAELVRWWEPRFRGRPSSQRLPSIEGFSFLPSYNLFDTDLPEKFRPALEELRLYVKGAYQLYLSQAYGIKNVDELEFEARCFGNLQVRGQRSFPHYHHTCDHVFVLYMDCGESRGAGMSLTNASGDGESLLQDPRHFSSFPFWDKVKIVGTYSGLTVLHPAFVWHESNPMNAEGQRTILVVTLKVVSHSYVDLYKQI